MKDSNGQTHASPEPVNSWMKKHLDASNTRQTTKQQTQVDFGILMTFDIWHRTFTSWHRPIIDQYYWLMFNGPFIKQVVSSVSFRQKCHRNKQKYTLQPGLCGENLLNSQEVLSEGSF